MKLRITISKYHSWYLCQISLQIILLPILTWRTIRRIVLARKVNCELICIDCFPKTSVLSLAGSELLIRSQRYSRSCTVTQRSFLLGCVTIRSQLPRTVIIPLPLKSPPFQGEKVNKSPSPVYYLLLNDRLYKWWFLLISPRLLSQPFFVMSAWEIRNNF